MPDLGSGVVYAAGSTSSGLFVRKYDPELFTLRQSATVREYLDVVGIMSLAGPGRVAMRVGESTWDATALLIFTFMSPARIR